MVYFCNSHIEAKGLMWFSWNTTLYSYECIHLHFDLSMIGCKLILLLLGSISAMLRIVFTSRWVATFLIFFSQIFFYDLYLMVSEKWAVNTCTAILDKYSLTCRGKGKIVFVCVRKNIEIDIWANTTARWKNYKYTEHQST